MKRGNFMGYESDLSDKQWELIKEFFDAKKGKHLQEHEKRTLVNGVLYRVKTGCQWRYIPNDFPDYRTIWSFYSRSVEKGSWEKAMDKLVKKVRIDAGRKADPSYGLIDSQSAKTANKNENRGIDGGKKGKGQKKTYSY
jgi:putative transposase